MRLLAADIGNSNTGIGLFDNDVLVGAWSGETDAQATDDELAATLSGLLALDGHRIEDVDAAAVESVISMANQPALDGIIADEVALKRVRFVPVSFHTPSLFEALTSKPSKAISYSFMPR